MRESNFAFPAQNRAAVCISSQLYDRRALDTNSPLPLFNSLTHLTYLTSTSPRIREIMVMDGGLERLVRMLHDFCISPPPPENPALLYGLLPPNYHPPKAVPTLIPKSFDKHAAYRFSLAFQCIVNIGVRGSELIRSRVVQAGTLDVVGCILESWLASKGFAVGPSSSATGMPRETREQRAARKQAQAEMRARQQALELARALERRSEFSHDSFQTIRGRSRPSELTIRATTISTEDDRMDTSADSAALSDDSNATQADISGIDSPTPTSDAASAAAGSDPDTSTDTSRNQTPAGSNTPTSTVEVPGRDRSGTIIARPIWDTTTALAPRRTLRTRDRQGTISASTSRGASRPETETEDDADGDLDMDPAQETTDNSPERPQTSPLTRRAVAIVSDIRTDTGAGQSLELNSDAHIIINSDADVQGDGVEDGIVALEPNDDFAMGAPPGAPGAIETTMTLRPTDTAVRRVLGGTDVTPRAVNVGLPRGREGRDSDDPQEATVRPNAPIQRTLPLPTTGETVPTAPRHHHHHHHHHDSGCPHRDEDVLSALQLLAYLSKYPHVRQAFYQPRTSFHPATATLKPQAPEQQVIPIAGSSRGKDATSNTGFLKAFASRNGKEKAPSAASTASAPAPPTSPRQTNVFSLVERFTFRPSSHECDLPNPPPTLPPEIQYWAGVIMRNACRKDDSRGGIRQCANMLCGRWEQYPRQFAKCRRCRKAKYCGKECQSSAWSEGHRFWCSAKDGDEDAENVPDSTRGGAVGGNGGGSVRRRERLMATTEITDAAIRATATAMAFRPIEGARPPEGPGWGRAFYEPSPFDVAPGPARRPVVHVGQEAAVAMGVVGRRRAETMPGGMLPVIDPLGPPPSAPAPTTNSPRPAPSPPAPIAPAPSPVLIPDHSHIFFGHHHDDDDGNSPAMMSVSAPTAGAGGGGTHGVRVELSMIAGPSRVVRNDDGAVFGFATGEEIAMDLD